MYLCDAVLSPAQTTPITCRKFISLIYLPLVDLLPLLKLLLPPVSADVSAEIPEHDCTDFRGLQQKHYHSPPPGPHTSDQTRIQRERLNVEPTPELRTTQQGKVGSELG